jgi:hypothetical protein
MRYLLTILCFFAMVSAAPGAWTDLLQKEFPKTPWAERPAVEQNVCLDCHDSNLMTPEYRAIVTEWRKSWHYQNGVSCQGCHGGDPRNAAKAMAPESGFVGVPKPKEVPKFCGKCHIGIMQTYLESDHGKALMTTGRGPNCLVCHGDAHKIQKANIEIIRPQLCGVCHSYDRARTIKASLLLTEQKMNEISAGLKTLKAGLIATQEEQQALFQTQAAFRTLFHTVDVNLVRKQTAEFTKKLDVINQQVQQGFQELRFRQNFAVFLMLILVALAITIFLLSRKYR